MNDHCAVVQNYADFQRLVLLSDYFGVVGIGILLLIIFIWG